jgi:hypothetical protein
MINIIKPIVISFVLSTSLYALIDAQKSVITVLNVTTFSEARKLTDSLSKYDMHIYKLKTKQSLFAVYAVNLEEGSIFDSLADIQEVSKSAYRTTIDRVSILAGHDFEKDIVIKKHLNQKTNKNGIEKVIAQNNMNILKEPHIKDLSLIEKVNFIQFIEEELIKMNRQKIQKIEQSKILENGTYY